jgi:uncharacterized membrane protein
MAPDAREKPEDTLFISDTAMAHLYRGELGRSDRWRTRLDTTTNWALTTTAAVISFGFGTATTHVTLLVGIWMVMTFLLIEARRYRYYDLWNRRVRLLEDGYWAPLLRHEPIDPDAMKELAQEMERPHIQLSFVSAISTRMNRAYGSLLLVLLFTWFVKVFSHPVPAKSTQEVLERAHVGPVPGVVVMGLLVLFSLLFLLVFVSSLVARPPLGELRTRRRQQRLGLAELMFRPYAVQYRRPRRTPSQPSPRPRVPQPP